MAHSCTLTTSASSDHKESLQQELRALSEEIRVVSKARSLKGVRERKAQQFRLTPYRERLVAAVYVLSGWDVRLAAQKLREFKGLGNVSDSPTQAERVVEDLYTKLPQDFAMQVWYPPDVSMHRVSMAARAYITESEVFSWVEQQNLQRGVAPSSVTARAKYEKVTKQHGGQVREDISLKHMRQWARRWSRRWQVKRGRLKKAEPFKADVIFGEGCLAVLQKISSLLLPQSCKQKE